MERFQKIKATRRKLDVSSICRFCGLENDEKYNILELNEDGVEFAKKISSMLSINVNSRDKMPQNVCFICMDKINDFYEFRLMAINTDKQTREALGLPLEEEKPQPVQQKQPILSLAQHRQRVNQLNKMPVVKLVDLKYSIQDQQLITKAFSRLASIKKEPNIPYKRAIVPTSTVTSQQYHQPPTKKVRKDISCNICTDANFSYLNDLTDHQIKEHLPLVSKYACGSLSCRETFEQLSDFKNHETMHSEQKLPYTCFICFSPYTKMRNFQKHMTNYNCPQKEKLSVTVEDIRCFQCNKKYLTQNLFEWHGCFLKTRGTCSKCGQFFVRKKALLKHYILCEGGQFVMPAGACDPNRNSVKTEKVSPSTRGSVVKVAANRGVRKKTVPQRRMTSIKSEREVNLGNVTQQSMSETAEEDEYANYEEDITYDNFGSDDDDEEDRPNLEPVVELSEQSASTSMPPPAQPKAPEPRIIDIKAEMPNDRPAVKELALGEVGADADNPIDSQIIRNIKREQGSKQAVVSMNKEQQQLALSIKAEKGANEQPVVQVLNPLAIGSSTATTSTAVTARKKVFKLPLELAVKIKKEKMNDDYGDGTELRDEAQADPEEEALMNSQESSSTASAIKREKIDSAYGDEVQQKTRRQKASGNAKQLINPMALALRREKNASNGSESSGGVSNSLVISAVTSMSANSSTNGDENSAEVSTAASEREEESEPQNALENSSTTKTHNNNSAGIDERSNNGEGSISSNSVEGSKSSYSSPSTTTTTSQTQVMVEIPAEFSKTANQHISPALTEMSTCVSEESNEVATTSLMTSTMEDALNTNEDDELNLLLENLEKFSEGVVVGDDSDLNVADNLEDSDLQDLLKFD